jgi:hypothetical protein
MATVQIDLSLISDRFSVGPVPHWASCLQVIQDAFNPGGYLLVGYLQVTPLFDPRARN